MNTKPTEEEVVLGAMKQAAGLIKYFEQLNIGEFGKLVVGTKSYIIMRLKDEKTQIPLKR